MITVSTQRLAEEVETVNALNVFPVPDGDTGINMSMTLTSGNEYLRENMSDHIGHCAAAFSKGLLMGARGNSGVILSQLFRGFATAVSDKEKINSEQFAAALQKGVDMAYQAVVKPVEGTILTVSKSSAKAGVQAAKYHEDILEVMSEVYQESGVALAKTPDQLAVLKQVGVVDSGGQGLVFIYEGFMKALSGKEVDDFIIPEKKPLSQQFKKTFDPMKAQSQLATEDIEFLYDMEFFIDIGAGKVSGSTFDADIFRQQLAEDGDSILVIQDEDFVKVHVHSRKPGDVFNYAIQYGELSRFQIENMREQHRDIVEVKSIDVESNNSADTSEGSSVVEANEARQPYGMVAVAVGEGIKEVLQSIGVDVILSGGQTMNPSTEEIVQAIKETNADQVFVFPNNSNIIMAAQQAKELVDVDVAVIPTKTISQGMVSALVFQEHLDFTENMEQMKEAISTVKSGQITHAVRDTEIDGVAIKEGDYLAIEDGSIITAESNIVDAVKHLIDHMIVNEDEIMTIFTGEDAEEETTKELTSYIEEKYEDIELDVLEGGQPLYPYLLSIES